MDKQHNVKIKYIIHFDLELTKEGVDRITETHGSMERFNERCRNVFKQTLEDLGEIESEYGNINISVKDSIV